MLSINIGHCVVVARYPGDCGISALPQHYDEYGASAGAGLVRPTAAQQPLDRYEPQCEAFGGRHKGDQASDPGQAAVRPEH